MSNAITFGVLILLALGVVFAGRACDQAINAAAPSPCALTTVDGVRCVYCTGREDVAVSCDWSTR